MTAKHWHCRPATPADEVAIVALQVECTHQLGLGFYGDAELGSYFRGIGIRRSDLIDRRTYYVVEEDGLVVGCGGWCDRPVPVLPELESFAPGSLQPAIRAFFVDPDYTRRGIGRAILTTVEADIELAGYRSVELLTTLSAANFFSSFGYKRLQKTGITLANGALLPAIKMDKKIDSRHSSTGPRFSHDPSTDS